MTPIRKPAVHCWAMWSFHWKWQSSRQTCTDTRWNGKSASLTVHSMLHLLGYDHETSPLEERKMREKEEEVLGELGISREATFTNQPEDTDA